MLALRRRLHLTRLRARRLLALWLGLLWPRLAALGCRLTRLGFRRLLALRLELLLRSGLDVLGSGLLPLRRWLRLARLGARRLLALRLGLLLRSRLSVLGSGSLKGFAGGSG